MSWYEILAALYLASGVIVWLAVLYAPLGHENSRGFHFGEEDQ
jgi:hypothetical protein